VATTLIVVGERTGEINVQSRPVGRVVTPVSQHYTVKPGDSLSKIAAIHGITGGWQSIYSKNKTVIGKNPNLIHPGQRLVL
jgi:LysM repeat protein